MLCCLVVYQFVICFPLLLLIESKVNRIGGGERKGKKERKRTKWRKLPRKNDPNRGQPTSVPQIELIFSFSSTYSSLSSQKAELSTRAADKNHAVCSLRRRRRGRMKASSVDLLGAVLFLGCAAMAAAGDGDVPAWPLPRHNESQSGCQLDLSNELFGGVGEACVRGGLDRSRCCPVLAAWLFAAHARSALELSEAPEEDGLDGVDEPMMPEDNQKCVESLQSALERRDIRLPRPNATCDTVLCFCGIRLHHIGPLRCPAAFNLSSRIAAPTASVRRLERDCRNASYTGCSRCLSSLDKVKKGNGGGGDGGDRAARMFAWDCELMSLTWLLARNKTAYIPTVSAVLRALLYTDLPAAGGGRCSPDLENMPLAVDSLQFQHLGSDEAISAALPTRRPVNLLLRTSFSLAVVFAGVPFL